MQNMIFEVQDLVVASPATVSRCGMVYVEPGQMGWRPLRDSWMQAELPSTLTQAQRDHVSLISGQYWTVQTSLAQPCRVAASQNASVQHTASSSVMPVSICITSQFAKILQLACRSC